MTQTVARFSSIGDLMTLGEVIEGYPLTSSITFAPQGTTNVIPLTDLSSLFAYHYPDPSNYAIQQSNKYWRVQAINPQGNFVSEILMGKNYTASAGQTWTESFYFMWDGNATPSFNFTFFTNNGHHSVAANVQSLGNGLYRAYATYTLEAGATYIRALDFFPPSSSYNWTYMDIYYAQLEQQSIPTPWVNGTRPDNCILLAGQIMEDVNNTWVASNLNHNTGSNVSDPDSTTGTARKYTAGTDTNGALLTWGPYYTGLAAGHPAILYFRLKASKTTNTANVVMIEGFDNKLGNMGNKYIKGTDFLAANTYQWFGIPLNIPSGFPGGGLELYCYPQSTDTDIYIDTIRVAQPKIIQPTTSQNMGMGPKDLYLTSRLQENATNAISFTANSGQYINIPNNPSLQVTGNQTIELIMILNNIGSYRMNPIYKSYGAEFAMTVETSGSVSYYWGTAGSDGNPYQGFGTSTNLTNNQLYHVTLVRDISNQKLTWYINGNQDSQTTTSYSAAVASTNPVKFFSGYAGGTPGGTLIQARIWNVALTPSQINQYLFSDLIGNESGLVGYWKFRESYGTTCFDSTSNGNNGTIQGSAARVFV